MKIKRKKLFLSLLLIGAQSCAFPSLRKDLNDETQNSTESQGGRWPEGGLLSAYDAVGHSERGPAGVYTPTDKEGSWLTPENIESNRRDFHRGDVAYSAAPTVSPRVKRAYKNGTRATASDFIDEVQNEGSLWASDGQTNYFFTENRIKSSGDVLAIKIQDALHKSIAQEVKKTLNRSEREMELELAQKRLTEKAKEEKLAAKKGGGKDAPKKGKEKGKGKKEEEEDVEVRDASYADIDVAPSLGVQPGEKIITEIVDRYPNGQYKIRGIKRIQYGGRTSVLNIVAVARGVDIEGKEEIESDQLFEYRVGVYR